MRNYLLALMLLMLQSSSFALTYDGLRDDVRQADGFVEGRVEKIDSMYIDVKPLSWSGVEKNFEGNVRINLASKDMYELGEHVVFLIDNNIGHHTMLNGSHSSFTVRRIGARQILISKNSTQKSTLGQIDLGRFYEVIEQTKGSLINRPPVDYKKVLAHKREKQMLKRRPKVSRGLASVTSTSDVNENKFSVVWLLLLMGTVGAVIRKLNKNV